MLEFLSCVVAGSLAYLLGFLRGSSRKPKVDDQPAGQHAKANFDHLIADAERREVELRRRIQDSSRELARALQPHLLRLHEQFRSEAAGRARRVCQLGEQRCCCFCPRRVGKILRRLFQVGRKLAFWRLSGNKTRQGG